MKKGLLAIAMASILGLASTELLAWGGGPGWCNGPGYGKGSGPRHGGSREYGYLVFLSEQIGLSDEQIQKVIKIDADYRAKYFTSRKDSEKLDALRIEHRKAVESVLTDAQKKKLDDYYKNRRGPGYFRGHGPGGY